MKIIDIENSVNFYFDRRKELQEMVRKAEEEANWEIKYSLDYKEGISGWKETLYKGKSHSRNDEPSYIYYHSDGTKTLGWHKKDKCHRLTGPAWIGWTGIKKYYIEGIEYDYSDWLIERGEHKDWKE